MQFEGYKTENITFTAEFSPAEIEPLKESYGREFEDNQDTRRNERIVSYENICQRTAL